MILFRRPWLLPCGSALLLLAASEGLAQGQEPAKVPTAPEGATESAPSTEVAPSPAENEKPASEGGGPGVNPASAPSAPSAPPAPYSVPWSLRPLPAPTVLRLESTGAFYEDSSGQRGFTSVNVFTGSYKVPGTGGPAEGLALTLRGAFMLDSPPGAGSSGSGFSNPLVGAVYARKLGSGFRANAFLGVTAPIGQGGGNLPDAGSAAARARAIPARGQMDNALFAVNDLTVIPGVSVGYVADGLTVQWEATLLQLTRVRGSQAQPESSKTNFTTGLHLGYYFLPEMSLGADLRYQRWLEGPPAVKNDASGASQDNLSFAVGPRFHIEVAPKVWARPGVSYQRGLDKPLSAATPNYHTLQVDIPVFF